MGAGTAVPATGEGAGRWNFGMRAAMRAPGLMTPRTRALYVHPVGLLTQVNVGLALPPPEFLPGGCDLDIDRHLE